jgi:AcrR family transcriptional regulator
LPGRVQAWQCYNVSSNVPSLLDAAPADGGPDEGTDPTTVRILDAALEELLAYGLRRAAMEDIARRAGVARITIYRRFPTKDDLVRAVLLREGRRVFDQVDAVVAGLGDLEDQITEGFAAILAATRAHPLLQRLLVTEADQTIASLTTHGGPVVAFGREYLVGHLEAARRAGRLAAVDVRAVAEILVRLTLSFLLTPESAIALHTPDDARAFARRFLVPALTAGAVDLRPAPPSADQTPPAPRRTTGARP